MCVYIYICIYIDIHIYMYTYIYLYTYTGTPTAVTISAKKPYIFSKQPDISAIEACIPATQPCISAKEPYTPAKEPYTPAHGIISHMRINYACRCAIFRCGSTLFSAKKNLYILWNKPYISTTETDVTARINDIFACRRVIIIAWAVGCVS